MNTHKVTTTTEVSRWEDGAWVPVERIVRIQTEDTAPLGEDA